MPKLYRTEVREQTPMNDPPVYYWIAWNDDRESRAEAEVDFYDACNGRKHVRLIEIEVLEQKGG